MWGRMIIGMIVPAALAASALAAAQPPSAFSQAIAGMWEIDGLPGNKTPLRQCIADVATLAQFEHRGRACQHSVIAEGVSSTTMQYRCGAGNFGRSEIDVITPRSLRISTQGISDSLPFNYVLQARRVGECVKSPSPPRH